MFKKITTLFLLLVSAATFQIAQAARSESVDSSPDGPDGSTATYGDWIISCKNQKMNDTKKPERFCEIVQTLQATLPTSDGAASEPRAIAQLAIGKVSVKDPYIFTVVVLPDVLLPSQLSVSIDGVDTAKNMNLSWSRCFARGCFASMNLSSEAVSTLRKNNGTGMLQWPLASGQNLQIKFSLKGLNQAFGHYESK